MLHTKQMKTVDKSNEKRHFSFKLLVCFGAITVKGLESLWNIDCLWIKRRGKKWFNQNICWVSEILFECNRILYLIYVKYIIPMNRRFIWIKGVRLLKKFVARCPHWLISFSLWILGLLSTFMFKRHIVLGMNRILPTCHRWIKIIYHVYY